MIKDLLIVTVIIASACNSAEKKSTAPAQDIVTPAAKDTIPVQLNPPPPPPSGKIDIETFGPIKIGQSGTDAVKALGEPVSKSKPVLWEADGLMHEDWVYKAQGLTLNMSYEKEKPGMKNIASINATASCAFKTRANMGIGSTYNEVKEAYKRDIDPTATEKDQVVVGSIYGGIAFGFKNEKVNTIFLGAMAE